MANTKVGSVTHFYDKINVAIIDLEKALKVGDKVKFERGGEDLFEQKVDSMEVEHESVESAKKGDTIGLKVDQQIKEGAQVYKV